MSNSNSNKKRFRYSIVISVAVHAVFLMGILNRFIPKSQPPSIPIQIEIVSQPKGNAAVVKPLSTHNEHQAHTLLQAKADTVVRKRITRHTHAVANPTSLADSSDTVSSDTVSSDTVSSDKVMSSKIVEASDVTASAPKINQKLKTRMTFSDFEKIDGNETQRTREEYAEQSLLSRRRHNPLAQKSKKLAAALSHRRSVLTGANVLPAGNNAALVTAYLQTLHKELAPRFSTFLRTLDSPSERIHRKVQNSPLKYNPFYVPPPESERQATLNGPMNDLSIFATTEFEILPNGELADVRLIRSSRHTVFDTAAIDTVIQSAPFPPPPARLLSQNNRSYLQWTFQRDWKKNNWAQGHLYIIGVTADTGSDSGQAPVQ